MTGSAKRSLIADHNSIYLETPTGYFRIFATDLKFAMCSRAHLSRELSNVGGISIIAVARERDNVVLYKGQ